MKIISPILVNMALNMIRERERICRKNGDMSAATAYSSAADMVQYAVEDNWECLRQFDCYNEDAGN